jgi:hypothetical protein
MHRQSLIADASQLEFRIVHRSRRTGWFGCCSPSNIGDETMTDSTDRQYPPLETAGPRPGS